MIIAILGGALITIMFALGYIVMWSPRLKKGDSYLGYHGGWKTAWTYHPWFLILTYIGTMVFEIWFLVHFAVHPPNW